MKNENQKEVKLKNDFVTLFKSIETTEKHDFEQYISFFYKQQKAVLTTFKKVVEMIAEKDENGLLGVIKNNKKTLNDLSDLKKWLLEFLTIQEVKKNTYEAKFLTLEALRKRKFKDVLAKKMSELSRDLSEDLSLNMWQSFMKLWLNHNAYYNTENDKLDDFQADVQQLMTDLDSFYISNKLKYYVELAQRTNILKESYAPKLLDDILVLLKNDSSLKPVIYNLFLPLLELVRDRSEAAFQKLKQFLLKNPEHNPAEKLSTFIYLLNFATHQIRLGNGRYNAEFLDLVEQIGLKQSLFTVAGYFPTTTFSNIVNASCTLERYAWATNFIDNWSVFLKPEDKEIATILAQARVFFAQNDFEAARKLLENKIQHQNIVFILNIRILLAQISYEQKQAISVQESHCDNLEQYAYKNKSIKQSIKESTLNFVKIMRLLIHEKPQTVLMNELENKKKSVFCYDWFKQKFDSKSLNLGDTL